MDGYNYSVTSSPLTRYIHSESKPVVQLSNHLPQYVAVSDVTGNASDKIAMQITLSSPAEIITNPSAIHGSRFACPTCSVIKGHLQLCGSHLPNESVEAFSEHCRCIVSQPRETLNCSAGIPHRNRKFQDSNFGPSAKNTALE
jgi:hypothetical protein